MIGFYNLFNIENDKNDHIISIEDHLFEAQPFKVCPKTKDELLMIIAERLKRNVKNPYLLDINTSNITDFSDLFRPSILCHLYGVRLWDTTTIDIHTWNTSNVTDMERMFLGCSSLECIKGLENFNISKVEKFGGMFAGCVSLKNINIDDWNNHNTMRIKKNTYNLCVSCMFMNCKSSIIPQWYYSI